MTIHVFVGPSVEFHQFESYAGMVEFHPPAKHGSLFSLSLTEHDAILIIDGVYQQSEPLRHKEILDVLSRGIRVIGASSMGALRAAELDIYGMEGFGTVYEWYRKGRLTSDADVAVTHENFAPYLATSVPIVNVVWACDVLVSEGYITHLQREQVLWLANNVYYVERSRQYFIGLVVSDIPSLSCECINRLHALLGNDQSIKAQDATLAIKSLLAGPHISTHRPVQQSEFFTYYLLDWQLSHSFNLAGDVGIPDRHVIDYERIFDPSFASRIDPSSSIRAENLRLAVTDVSSAVSAAVEACNINETSMAHAGVRDIQLIRNENAISLLRDVWGVGDTDDELRTNARIRGFYSVADALRSAKYWVLPRALRTVDAKFPCR